MSDVSSKTPLTKVLETVDLIQTAWEMGNTEQAIADAMKLTAQVMAGIVVENALRTYSALDGLG